MAATTPVVRSQAPALADPGADQPTSPRRWRRGSGADVGEGAQARPRRAGAAPARRSLPCPRCSRATCRPPAGSTACPPPRRPPPRPGSARWPTPHGPSPGPLLRAAGTVRHDQGRRRAGWVSLDLSLLRRDQEDGPGRDRGGWAGYPGGGCHCSRHGGATGPRRLPGTWSVRRAGRLDRWRWMGWSGGGPAGGGTMSPGRRRSCWRVAWPERRRGTRVPALAHCREAARSCPRLIEEG